MARNDRPIVTLLSDFGSDDEYAAVMKGVVLSRCRDATVVDMTHAIPAGDVVRGALVLADAARWFPIGSIHVAVVDPGVGTERAPLLIDAGDRLYVGPDNGLLSLAARSNARAYRLDKQEFFAKPVSATFHGRDVFASVAGHLAAGRNADDVGTPVPDCRRISLPPARREGDTILGEVLYVDSFGNLITNISARDMAEFGDRSEVEVGELQVGRLQRTYADAATGSLLALVGSTGRLEIAKARGRAATALPAESAVGTPVRVRRAS